MDETKANERLVRIGGLMRCCLATVGDSEELTDVGTVMDCKYEPPGNANLIVGDDGAWRWNQGGK